MNLLLQRDPSKDKATLGELFIEGIHFCYTLEDQVRPEGEKVFGATAIPAGRYQVVTNYSEHFEKMLPLLLDVPNFAGVRIHSGNIPEDTDGCILLGFVKGEARVTQSIPAFAAFFTKLRAALNNHEDCWITITNEQ